MSWVSDVTSSRELQLFKCDHPGQECTDLEGSEKASTIGLALL